MKCHEWYYKTNFSLQFIVAGTVASNGTVEISWPADPTETRAMQQCGKPHYPYRPRRKGWKNCDRMLLTGFGQLAAYYPIPGTFSALSIDYLPRHIAPDWDPNDIAYPRAMALFDYQRENNIPNAAYWNTQVTLVTSGGGDTVTFHGFKSGDFCDFYTGGSVTYNLMINA